MKGPFLCLVEPKMSAYTITYFNFNVSSKLLSNLQNFSPSPREVTIGFNFPISFVSQHDHFNPIHNYRRTHRLSKTPYMSSYYSLILIFAPNKTQSFFFFKDANVFPNNFDLILIKAYTCPKEVSQLAINFFVNL